MHSYVDKKIYSCIKWVLQQCHKAQSLWEFIQRFYNKRNII
jgi:hypothetical protein